MALLGFNAGFFLSFGSLAAIVVAAEFAKLDPDSLLAGAGAEAGMAKLLYALLFPIGLVLIVLAGSELL